MNPTDAGDYAWEGATVFTPKRIILHCSATEDGQTVSWQAIRRFHMTDAKHLWSDIGYHFGVERVNDRHEVLVGRMMNCQGAHCSGENADSLGICFVGNFDQVAPPLEQWQMGVRLVRALCRVLGIMPDKVFGHREFTDQKTCPGLKFNLDEFRAQLNPY